MDTVEYSIRFSDDALIELSAISAKSLEQWRMLTDQVLCGDIADIQTPRDLEAIMLDYGKSVQATLLQEDFEDSPLHALLNRRLLLITVTVHRLRDLSRQFRV